MTQTNNKKISKIVAGVLVAVVAIFIVANFFTIVDATSANADAEAKISEIDGIIRLRVL